MIRFLVGFALGAATVLWPCWLWWRRLPRLDDIFDARVEGRRKYGAWHHYMEPDSTEWSWNFEPQSDPYVLSQAAEILRREAW